MKTQSTIKIIILLLISTFALLSCSQLATETAAIGGGFSYPGNVLSTMQGTATNSAPPTWSEALSGQTVSYSLTPAAGGALTTGINIDATTGVISVADSVALQSSNYTVTATGTGDWSGTISAQIRIEVLTFEEAFNNTYPKGKAGEAGTFTPSLTPEGNLTYRIDVLKEAVGTPTLPTIDSSTGEVTVSATTTAGTYEVSVTVEGGNTYTAPFYVAIFASTKVDINNELLGNNKGIAMWGDEGDYNYLDTRAVTDMSSLIAPTRTIGGGYDRDARPAYRTFNGDISSWKTDNVARMNAMFFGASTFNQDISTWSVDNVTNMRGMFYEAIAFNQDIGSWKVDNVIDMGYMFSGAVNFNQDLEAWGKHLQGRTVNFTGMFTGSGVTKPPSWYPSQ